MAGVAVSRRPKKELERPPNGLERGAPRGRTPISPRELPGHERYRPHPAGHLAGRRAVRHARPLARLGHGVAPVPQAAVALRGVPRHGGLDPVARPRPLGAPRRHRHVPGRLDQRAPDVGVPRAGDPAARLRLAARALRGGRPHHEANDGAVGNLEKSPASAASRKAVATSTPFTRQSASTTGAHPGRAAASSTLRSSSLLASAQRSTASM